MTERFDSKPWYKQFWPWAIISLPGSAVIAGLATLYIAFENQDSLVKDNWYQEGKAINRRVEYDNNARALGLKAEIKADTITGDLNLSMSHSGQSFNFPEKLYLELIHPTLAERDQKIILTRTQAPFYHGNLQQALIGKRHINLSNNGLPQPSEDGSTIEPTWRLKGTTVFPLNEPLTLGQ
ncbi:MAG: FixH family protein [Pseudomonadales bacterium]|nr:FixH family protein [Pseudomonadales bacterium]